MQLVEENSRCRYSGEVDYPNSKYGQKNVSISVTHKKELKGK